MEQNKEILKKAAQNLGYKTTTPINKVAKEKLEREYQRLLESSSTPEEDKAKTYDEGTLTYGEVLKSLSEKGKIPQGAKYHQIQQCLNELQTRGSVTQEQKYKAMFSSINEQYGLDGDGIIIMLKKD